MNRLNSRDGGSAAAGNSDGPDLNRLHAVEVATFSQQVASKSTTMYRIRCLPPRRRTL
jgi:hypothetical protein